MSLMGFNTVCPSCPPLLLTCSIAFSDDVIAPFFIFSKRMKDKSSFWTSEAWGNPVTGYRGVVRLKVGTSDSCFHLFWVKCLASVGPLRCLWKRVCWGNIYFMKFNVLSEATTQGCSVTLHPECMRAAAGPGGSEACGRLAGTSNDPASTSQSQSLGCR